MKKLYFISTLFALGIASLIFSSYSNGLYKMDSINQSGSFSAAGSCEGAGCHDANSNGLVLLTKVYNISDPTLTAVNSYIPGQAYRIVIKGLGLFGRDYFGYQMSIVNASNKSQGFVTFNNATTQKPPGNIDVFEQLAPIEERNGDYIDSFTWIAPVAGKGTVKINWAMLASNNNGSPIGDVGNAMQKVLTEAAVNDVKDIYNGQAFTLYPNPSSDLLQIEIPNVNVALQFYVIGLSGNVMLQGNTASKGAINISRLPAGHYFLSLQANDQKWNKGFQKL